MEFDFFDAMGPVRAPLDWCSKATPSTTIGLTRRERGWTATKKDAGPRPRARYYEKKQPCRITQRGGIKQPFPPTDFVEISIFSYTAKILH